MFTVYAVRVVNGEKHRHVMGSYLQIEQAKHVANCAVCGNADYAYVKDFGDGTVFFLKAFNPYPEIPIEPGARQLNLPTGRFHFSATDQKQPL